MRADISVIGIALGIVEWNGGGKGEIREYELLLKTTSACHGAMFITFIRDFKIDLIMIEPYHIQLIFMKLNHGETLRLFIFEILHFIDLLDIFLTFWHMTSYLNHLSLSHGCILVMYPCGPKVFDWIPTQLVIGSLNV